MTEYATFVLCSDGAEAAQAARTLMLERFPFGSSPTRMTACATGDAMSVSDAMRMALECRALDSYEQREFALELAECVNWEGCLTCAAKWDLAVEQGDFVNAPPASADTLPQGQDAQQGLAGTESGAVGATSAETPSPSPVTSPAAGR